MAKYISIRQGTSAHPEQSVAHLTHDLIYQTGVVNLTSDWKVSEHNPQNMSIDITPGRGFFKKTVMTYHGYSDAVENIAIGANNSGNPRIDAVVLYVDLSVTPNSDASNVLKSIVVQGTPSSSPTPPTDNEIQTVIGSGNPFLRLANVYVASGASLITNADITDTKVAAYLKTPGGIKDCDGITLNNDKAIKQKDSNGTERSILNLNSSNDLEIGGDGINKLIFKTPFDGWIPANETWTYSSWDAEVYTGVITVPSDATTKYSPGMRIKITQSTGGTKYGIITAVATTSLTVFFGTDYTLNNETISNPYYSHHKAPFGFPLNPNKWKIELKPSNAYTANPTQNTWYNATNISIPIGVWRITIQAYPWNSYRTNTGRVSTYMTLSTTNNSESDADFTSMSEGSFAANVSEEFLVSILFAEKTLSISTKTTYYLNYKTTSTGMAAVGIGSIIIRIICAYL
jgi:hypothetical protein